MNLFVGGATSATAWESAIGQLRGPDHAQAINILRQTVLKAPEPEVFTLFDRLQRTLPFGKDLDPVYFALSDRSANWLGKWQKVIDGIR